MSDIFEPIFEPIISPLLRPLLEREMREQASWSREPVTAFRALTGDPRNESGSGGDAGGGEGSGGGEAAGGGAGGGASSEAPDIMAAFETFRDDFTQRFDGLAERIPEPPQETQPPERAPEPDIFDPRNFSDEDFDGDGYLTREAQQRAMQELVDQRIAEARAPELAAAAQARRDAEADALEAKYPDLQDQDKFQPVLEKAQAFAAHLVKVTGDRSHAEAWREPAFFEMVYLADVGRQAAGRETAAGQGQGGVTLESGGSAGPGAQNDDGGGSVAKSIVALAQKQKFRLGNAK